MNSAKKSANRKEDILTISILAAANFGSATLATCMAPFFPKEASQKGASQTVIGFIFAVYPLLGFIVSPIFGRYMSILRAKRLFVGCLLMAGILTITFGFLIYVPTGSAYIILSASVRGCAAIATSGFRTAEYSIIANQFPERRTKAISIIGAFYGLGCAMGAPIGGFLFDLGGYFAPFTGIGGFYLLVGCGAICCIPPQQYGERQPDGTLLSLLRIPSIVFMCLSLMISMCLYPFIDATLSEHLNIFKLSSTQVGLVYLLAGGTQCVATPIFGHLINKKQEWFKEFMIFGCLLVISCFVLLGPPPFIPVQKQLQTVLPSLVLMGIGFPQLYLPIFQAILAYAQSKGFADGMDTYGLVAGLFQSSTFLGEFIGFAVLGGLVDELLGTPWTSTLLAGICFMLCMGLSFTLVYDVLSSPKTVKPDEKAAELE